MKATRKFGIWKAIAFLTAVICLFSCTSCEPEFESWVKIGEATNITQTSATLVAEITPNGDNVRVSFQYQALNSDWKSQSLAGKFSGNKAIKVTLDVFDLKPNTLYKFKVSAGSASSSGSSFTTKGLALIKMNPATNVTLSTATLNAVIIPVQSSTSIAFEYQETGSTWVSKSLGSSFSGTDSVKVKLDLSDLKLNTLYNFRVRTSSVVGEALSSAVSFQTFGVSDYNGNLYHTVTIGSQTWLKENFRGTHFANGDPIPNVSDTKAWGETTTGAYCWYNQDPALGKIYGGLYNWYVASDKRALISGWHVPTGYEYSDLMRFFGDRWKAYSPMIETSSKLWLDTNFNTTNSSGFSALPNGGIGDSYSELNKYYFSDLGTQATFWAEDWFGPGASAMTISANESYLSTGKLYKPNVGMGIRLLKN